MKQVGFEALIQEVKIKSLKTGDKSMRITFEMDSPSDDLIDGINRLHKADREVSVGIVAIDNTEKNNAIQKRTRSNRRQAEGGEV